MAKHLMAANGNDGSFWTLNSADQALRYLGTPRSSPNPRKQGEQGRRTRP